MKSVLKTLFISLTMISFAWSQPTTKADALKNWEKRDVKESLVVAISKFDQLYKQKPDDKEVLIYLMRSHFMMGDFHLSDKREKLEHFEKAFQLGDQALEKNAEYSSKLKKGDDIQDAVKTLSLDDVPVMFWTAANLGKYAKTNGIFSSMRYKGKILALIGRVEELAPDYFHGAVPRYWGAYYAVIPRIAGKDLKKSKKYFEQSIKMAPEYVATKVIQADTYFVEADDPKGFRNILNSVLTDSTYDFHPDLGPENRMEKIRAKKLLEKVDDLF